MPWLALAVGIMVYFGLRSWKHLSLTIIVGLFLSLVFTLFYFHNHAFKDVFSDHERFVQWRQIFKDWTGPLAQDKGLINNFCLTGRGIGSFRFLYHVQNNLHLAQNRFHQAHNDFLEFGYSAGFIGLGLLVMAIFYMVKNVIREVFQSDYVRALLASLAYIVFDGVGSFVFQIGTFCFFTVVICGLISNERKILCPLPPPSLS